VSTKKSNKFQKYAGKILGELLKQTFDGFEVTYDFIASRLGVDSTSVRNWIDKGIEPKSGSLILALHRLPDAAALYVINRLRHVMRRSGSDEHPAASTADAVLAFAEAMKVEARIHRDGIVTPDEEAEATLAWSRVESSAGAAAASYA
jgi:hypothetical protein